jgi:hypothetical protein
MYQAAGSFYKSLLFIGFSRNLKGNLCYTYKVQKRPYRIGSFILNNIGSWRYCTMRIENDKDLSSWEFFKASLLNK